MKNDAKPSSIEEKMDVILDVLKRMDRRDRMRTIGGFIRGIISIIPIILFLWATWWTIENWDELLDTLIKKSATEAQRISEESTQNFLERFVPKQ